MANLVFIILNREFAGNLDELALCHHVWIIGSKHNVKMAKLFWDHNRNIHGPDYGVTTINDGDDLPDILYSYLDEIDVHHNECSTDYPWDQIHVIGLGLREINENKTRRSLLGNTIKCESSKNGFIIIKLPNISIRRTDE